MSTVKTGTPVQGLGFDFANIDISALFDYFFVKASTTSLKLYDDGANYTEFKGTGFAYAGDAVVGGTVTQLKVVVAGATVLHVTGASVSAVAVYNAYLAGDSQAAIDLFLAANDTVSGTGFNDSLQAGAGNDTVNGMAGADAMAGGTGDDTYIVDNAGDSVQEGGDPGLDTVRASVSFTLDSNVENLVLTGSVAINGIGNGLANNLLGNAAANTLEGLGGNDILNGGTGADLMRGGDDDDTYVVDNPGDQVDESASTGTDTVQSTVTFALGAGVEHLTLTGTRTANATGNSLDNNITGNSGANIIDGGGGTDDLAGLGGNDTYILRSGTEQVTEQMNAGTDTVRADFTWILGANLENLTLTGGADSDATGNSAANTMVGNAGVNTMVGLQGADKMDGGLGTDTVSYLAENGPQGVIVDLSKGTATDSFNTRDKVTNFENVEGTNFADTLTGSNAANTIQGFDGNDVLAGLLGADILDGGADQDTASYARDKVGVKVDLLAGTAAARDGATATQLLQSHAEGDTLSDIENVVGTSAADSLAGNTEDNVFTGGNGNDVFVFRSFAAAGQIGHDRVSDFKGGTAVGDQVQIDESWLTDLDASGVIDQQDALLAFQQVGTDWVFAIDADNSITLVNAAKTVLAANDFIVI